MSRCISISTEWPELSPASTTTTSSSTSSPTPTAAASSGLSSGAKAGIGVGVSVGAIVILALGFLFFIYRRRARRNASQTGQSPSSGYGPVMQDDRDGALAMTEQQKLEAYMGASPVPQGPPQELSAQQKVGVYSESSPVVPLGPPSELPAQEMER